MLKLAREHRFFLLAISCYFLAVIGICVNEYYQSKKSLLVEVDKRLYVVASMADNILLQEMGDNVVGKRPITPHEDYLLALKLQALADDLDVEYVYSMRLEGTGIVFLASNPSPEERLNSDTYQTVFLKPYSDAPIAIYTALGYSEPQVFQYKDEWGYFRSLFFPSRDQEQTPYVVGVDVNMETIQIIALKSMIKAFLYGVLLALIIFPIVFLYVRLLKRNYLEQLDVAEIHPVTGLPNKRRLSRETQKSKSAEQHLFLIRIENFHDISNLNSVAFGDQLLLRLSYQLRDLPVSGMEHCKLYHLDETLFGLYTQDPLGRRQQVEIVSTAFETLAKTQLVALDGRAMPLILRMAAASNDPDVYTLANMALSYAATHDKTFVEYQPTLELPVYFQRYLDIYSALYDALENDKVSVFYQPIVDATTAKIVKYEALMRILSGDSDSVLSPEKFMPIAYQSRLCHKLTRIVLEKVIAVLQSTKIKISINLSIKDLFDQATRDHIIKKVRQHDVGNRLELELLEQQSITNYKRAAAYIRQLKSCVSAVGMDDLGKLYSNVDRLLELPLDFLKIDGALIESLVSNEGSQVIVSGMVKFAEHRKMQVVAEFCSSAEVCQKVSAINIPLMQGFYICAPKASIEEADAQVAQLDWSSLRNTA